MDKNKKIRKYDKKLIEPFSGPATVLIVTIFLVNTPFADAWIDGTQDNNSDGNKTEISSGQNENNGIKDNKKNGYKRIKTLIQTHDNQKVFKQYDKFNETLFSKIAWINTLGFVIINKEKRSANSELMVRLHNNDPTKTQ